MRGWEGALCLSCWPDDASGVGEAGGSYPTQDRHQAPTSAPPFPLSLQGGEQLVSAVTGVGR
jgi:hypothetical protein